MSAENFVTFLVEWHDAEAALVRSFNLRYFLNDAQIDMFDLKQRKTFLKKCSYPSITLADLYPGAQVTIFARTLKVVDYADQVTRNRLAPKKQTAVFQMSRPSLSDLAKVLTDLTRASLQVTQLRRCIMNSADVTIIQVLGENAVQVIASLRSKGQSSGSTSPWSSASTALTGDPAKALVDEVFTRESDIHVRNTAAASSTTKLSTTQSNLTVTRPSTTAKLSGTVLVIRPHAVATGLAGPILEQIAKSGFDASAIEMFVLDRPGAQEFCEVYKGVVPEYHGMVEQLTAGPLIAAELHYTSDDAKSVTKLREVCGPADPAVAQVLRPGTLRARFGQNKVLNAVHCTDLEEDGPLEAQYFFSILQQ